MHALVVLVQADVKFLDKPPSLGPFYLKFSVGNEPLLFKTESVKLTRDTQEMSFQPLQIILEKRHEELDFELMQLKKNYPQVIAQGKLNLCMYIQSQLVNNDERQVQVIKVQWRSLSAWDIDLFQDARWPTRLTQYQTMQGRKTIKQGHLLHINKGLITLPVEQRGSGFIIQQTNGKKYGELHKLVVGNNGVGSAPEASMTVKHKVNLQPMSQKSPRQLLKQTNQNPQFISQYQEPYGVGLKKSVQVVSQQQLLSRSQLRNSVISNLKQLKDFFQSPAVKRVRGSNRKYQGYGKQASQFYDLKGVLSDFNVECSTQLLKKYINQQQGAFQRGSYKSLQQQLKFKKYPYQDYRL